MKRLNADFNSLIVQLLPPHKRQRIRVKILQILFNLAELFNEFLIWRKKQLYLTNITSQVKILEGYLETIFGSRIQIKEGADKLLGIPLIGEGPLRLMGLSSEPDKMVPFPLLIEIGEDLQGADFMVQAPANINTEELSIEIEKYKQMDKKYIIKQQ